MLRYTYCGNSIAEKKLRTLITEIFESHASVSEATLTSLAGPIASTVEAVVSCFASGRKIMLCGNGGSAADAQHLAAEFEGRFLRERRPLPAMALSTNSSSVTAIGNDYGFERVFARAVEAHGREGDVFIGITTSGNSPNVIEAAKVARDKGLTVVGLTGASGGLFALQTDILLAVPSESTPRIQEMHILMGHVVCELVEQRIVDA